MLLFNKYNIKKSSSLISAIKKQQNVEIKVTGDFDDILTIFNITDPKVNAKDLIDVILNNRKNIRSIVRFIQKNTDNIDISRLLEYIQYRQKNPFSSNDETVLKLMYGDKKGGELFSQQQNKFSKYYTTEYYMGLGYSEEESLVKIQEYKNNKSTNLSNFIKKYGNIDGVDRYNEYVDKSKNTIKTFKERYGKEWGVKWINYTKKDSSSYNWALKKAEGDVDKATKIFNDKLKKTTVTLDYLINKYGEEGGSRKWNDIKNLKDSSSLGFFIKKYDNLEIAKEMYDKSNKIKDSSSLGFFIKKYGDEKVAIEKYLDKCKKSDCCSFDFFSKKYDDEQTVIQAYKDNQLKRKVKTLKASKSSLNIFYPLYNFLIKNEIVSIDDVYLGVDNSHEYFIKTDEFLFFYDFTILSKKIIIEFNGKAWHPNWEKYGIIECRNFFKNKNVDVDSMVKKDIIKINLAKQKGFDVLILWEEDGIDVNKEKLYNYLLKKGIKYEN